MRARGLAALLAVLALLHRGGGRGPRAGLARGLAGLAADSAPPNPQHSMTKRPDRTGFPYELMLFCQTPGEIGPRPRTHCAGLTQSGASHYTMYPAPYHRSCARREPLIDDSGSELIRNNSTEDREGSDVNNYNYNVSYYKIYILYTILYTFCSNITI